MILLDRFSDEKNGFISVSNAGSVIFRRTCGLFQFLDDDFPFAVGGSNIQIIIAFTQMA